MSYGPLSLKKQKTKDLIYNALMELMRTKNLNSLSITELCKKAGVSRVTFYRYYEILEDVILEYIDQIFTNYFDLVSKTESIDNHTITLLFFNRFREEKTLIVNLMNSNASSILLEKCNEYLFALTNRIVGENLYEKQKENYIVKFVVGGFFNTLIEWTSNNMNESDEYMAEILYKFCE
ncbi:TetR/AcrR family transcriptional regulator [Paenibacillus jiagnxiensis]|uniref:TetR/AcrR family transcriptional regulator n=1 Tax=Paenibacillus jiagnxiensis TaxID=3228926 RepID=UPI0033B83EED